MLDTPAMVRELRAIADRATKVQLLFTTNMEDQGQINARLPGQLMAGVGTGVNRA